MEKRLKQFMQRYNSIVGQNLRRKKILEAKKQRKLEIIERRRKK